MSDRIEIKCLRYHSPCGRLVLGAAGDALCLCDWDFERRRAVIDGRLQEEFNATLTSGVSRVTDEAARQLDEYFAGKRRAFEIPLIFGGSDFRHRVWKKLLELPFGSTVTYGEIARRLGQPTAVRAVASAIGANPISIFVPCHRVIGADGSLTGYAGGTEAKKLLLAAEVSGNFAPKLGIPF